MKKAGYSPGEVCWVDCGTDLDKATAFYGALFGWTVQDMGASGGGYLLASKDGAMVAGLGPKQNPGPPFWSVYFRVDDAAKAAELVEANGGSVLFGPSEVLEAGHMAVFTDPVGAAFSVWQPNQHLGFGVESEPGAFCWAELTTTDVPASKSFYGEVFGFGAKDGEDATMQYTEFRLDEAADRRHDAEAGRDARGDPAVLGRLLHRRGHRRHGGHRRRARRHDGLRADGRRVGRSVRPVRRHRRRHVQRPRTRQLTAAAAPVRRAPEALAYGRSSRVS